MTTRADSPSPGSGGPVGPGGSGGDDGRPVIALRFAPADVEAAAAAEYVAAHLGGFRCLPECPQEGDSGPGRNPPAAVIVFGRSGAAGGAGPAGVPTVLVEGAEPVPGTDADVVCRQAPGWLTAGEPPAPPAVRPGGGRIRTVDVAAVAPFRQVRSGGGGGRAALLLGGAGGPDGSGASAGGEALPGALARFIAGHPAAAGDAWAVLTDLTGEPLRELLGLLPPTARTVGAADWAQVLRRADSLVATPTLLAAAHARTARIPLHVLDPAGPAQRRVHRALAAIAGAPGEPGGLPVVGPDDWPRDDGRAGALGGAAQIARQVRQLCLAPA
uniref:CGA synthase-related protein n=1 Tax=Streptomyces rimofaciens TaxID=504097 RepID=H9BDX1_9ACTN|nr:hypothetical protein [Streptomyces rimofaciens]